MATDTPSAAAARADAAPLTPHPTTAKSTDCVNKNQSCFRCSEWSTSSTRLLPFICLDTRIVPFTSNFMRISFSSRKLKSSFPFFNSFSNSSSFRGPFRPMRSTTVSCSGRGPQTFVAKVESPLCYWSGCCSSFSSKPLGELLIPCVIFCSNAGSYSFHGFVEVAT